LGKKPIPASLSGLINLDQTAGRFLLGLIVSFLLTACFFQGEEAYFREAEVHLEKGEFQKAVQAYQAYLNKYPQGASRDKAIFLKGSIFYHTLDNKSLAVLAFSQLAEDFPESQYCFQAREILARIYQNETNDYLRAAVEYRWLLNQSPDARRRAEYQYRFAHCYFLANELDKSITALNELIAQYPDSEYLERAYDELGSAYMIINLPEQALEVFQAMLESFPESPLKPSIEFKIGECYEVAGRLEEALAQYTKVRDIYNNRSAVDIRLEGVKSRLEKKHGKDGRKR